MEQAGRSGADLGDGADPGALEAPDAHGSLQVDRDHPYGTETASTARVAVCQVARTAA